MRAGHEKTRQCVKKHKRVHFKKTQNSAVCADLIVFGE